MFRDYENPILRKKIREIVESEMIPLEKSRAGNDKVPVETSTRLRTKLMTEGYLGNGMAQGNENLSAYSIMTIYEELHRSLLGFWGAGVIDGVEPMNSNREDWASEILKAGVYPVTKLHWCEIIPEKDGVSISGRFTVVGDQNCQWFWIDSQKVLINRSSPGVRIHTRDGVGISEVSEVYLDKVAGNQFNSHLNQESNRNPQITFMFLRLGAGAIGSSLRAVEDAIEFSKTRVTFGKPISDRQAIQWKLAEAARDVQGARLALLESTIQLERDPNIANVQSLAAVAASDAITVGLSIFEEVIQIFGGKGYGRSFWVEEAFRNLLGYQAIINVHQTFKKFGRTIKQQGTLFRNELDLEMNILVQ